MQPNSRIQASPASPGLPTSWTALCRPSSSLPPNLSRTTPVPAEFDWCRSSALPASARATGPKLLPVLALQQQHWRESALWHFSNSMGLTQVICIGIIVPLDCSLSFLDDLGTVTISKLHLLHKVIMRTKVGKNYADHS